MAKKKSSKKFSAQRQMKKQVKKAAKKNPVVFIVVLLVVVIALGVAGYFLYRQYENETAHSSSSSEPDSSVVTSLEGDFTPISFHFIEQDVPNSGDVIFVQAGDNDILIDGGAKPSVAQTVIHYLDENHLVTDGKLEYVVATHAHQDHLAGLYGVVDKNEPSGRNGLLYHYEVGTIIDFSYYNISSFCHLNDWTSESEEFRAARTNKDVTSVYESYLKAREYAVSKGATHYLAKDLSHEGNNWKTTLGKGLEMELLYQFFYDHTRDEVKTLDPSYSPSRFSDQNDCSVSLLFSQGSHHFLLTGDSEEYAEASLVKSNHLPKCDLFKAGHHGSYTASGDALLDVIDPDLIVCCACAGNTEYASNLSHTFPAQEAIDRFAKHTDRVYVTTLGNPDDPSDKVTHSPMNGNVVVLYDGKGKENVTFSHNDLKLKDTVWFQKNRKCPTAWAA
ncbi:MAG: MBL fold metallo-hydrolase [Erysipelotrichaceae bacterium]|nr:MBL fold metallo-hydrolase [Erysipelotrichaceae bacterium]